MRLFSALNSVCHVLIAVLENETLKQVQVGIADFDQIGRIYSLAMLVYFRKWWFAANDAALITMLLLAILLGLCFQIARRLRSKLTVVFDHLDLSSKFIARKLFDLFQCQFTTIFIANDVAANQVL